MKIFKMNDCDWCAAETLEDAMLALSKTVSDGDVDEAFKEEFIDEPYEVEDRNLDVLKFVDEDDESVPPISFRDELTRRIEAGEQFPQYFASSEY